MTRLKHKHRFVWYIEKPKTEIRNKVIKCIICKKSLDDVIDAMLWSK